MSDGVILVLDTTVAEDGPAQAVDHVFLKQDRVDGGTRFFVAVGAGDTILIQGKAESADDYSTLQSITASGMYDVKLAPIWRASRSVDGGGADSVVKVMNLHNQAWTEHTA